MMSARGGLWGRGCLAVLALAGLSACGVDSQLDVRLDWSAVGGPRPGLSLRGVLHAEQRCPSKLSVLDREGVSFSELATQHIPAGPAMLVVQAFLPTDADKPIFAGCVELNIDKDQAARTASVKIVPVNMAIRPHMPLLAARQGGAVRVVHRGAEVTGVAGLPLQLTPGDIQLRTDADGVARWETETATRVRFLTASERNSPLTLKAAVVPGEDWMPTPVASDPAPTRLSGASLLAVQAGGAVVQAAESQLRIGAVDKTLDHAIRDLVAMDNGSLALLDDGPPQLLRDASGQTLVAADSARQVTALGRVRGHSGVALISARAVEVSIHSKLSGVYVLGPDVADPADPLVEAAWAWEDDGWAIGRTASGAVFRWSTRSGARRMGVGGVAVDLAWLDHRWGAVWGTERCPSSAGAQPCFLASAPIEGGGCLMSVVEHDGALWCTAYPLPIIPAKLCSFSRDQQTGVAVLGKTGGLRLIPAAANGAWVPERAIQVATGELRDLDCAPDGRVFALLSASELAVLEVK